MLRRSPSLCGLASCFEKIFLINLDRRPDRWAQFQSEFARSAGQQALDLVERIPAVDGATLDLSALQKAGLLSRLGLRRLQEPPSHRLWGMDLSPGAVGCALSHMSLWARIAALGVAPAEGRGPARERRFLVLEDDCIFPPTCAVPGCGTGELPRSFEDLYRERLEHVPNDGWGLLYLSGLDTHHQCGALMVGEGVARVPQFHRTTNAYVVTPSGARELLEVCVPITFQIDTMMTMNVMADGPEPAYVRRPRCYTLMPPLLVQSAVVPGDIQEGEAERTAEEREAEDVARRRAAGWGGSANL